MKSIKIRGICKGRGGSLARVLYSCTISEDDSKRVAVCTELSHVKDTFNTHSIDNLQHSSTSVLLLPLVRGSGANQGAAIFWQLIEMSGLLGGVYTELYRAVHRVLSAIRNNGVSVFQGEIYTGRIGPIVGTLESVRFSGVSAKQGSTVHGN